ncbi:MAG: membrane protein insertion efficiency factor YidD [Planctomycetes bacterium]|nr:membrane protein insertion efficiency factor YidD [Planctomycetota bacterium]
MSRLAVSLIRGYQKYVRHMLPPACRFTPTCSEYCIEAIQKKGLLFGLLKGVFRILRCNPLCRGGYDPVE